MSTADPEALRLNAYLDARVLGMPADALSLNAGLGAAYERVRSLNDGAAPAPGLLAEIRGRVIPAPIAAGPRPMPGLARLDRDDRAAERGRTGRLRELGAAVALVAAVLVALVGYGAIERRGGGDRPTAIPAASLQASGTPTVTGCLATPREPGSVEALIGTPVARLGYLPRFSDDPTRIKIKRTDGVDEATLLLGNSAPTDRYRAEIGAVLEQIVACRFYASLPDGRSDLDGRFFALFSDDYFRRELSGYREADKSFDAVNVWMPSVEPALLDVRSMSDGRILATVSSTPGWTRALPTVLILVQERDRLLVDEVGFAAMPVEQISPTAASGAPDWATGVLLRLEFALYDGDAPERDYPGKGAVTVCDQFGRGTPVPCGARVQGFGPYNYNELPAGADVTITLYNLGQTPKRVAVAELGITVDVAPAGSATFVLNAPAGSYLYTVTEGGSTTAIGGGVFTVIPANQRPTQG